MKRYKIIPGMLVFLDSDRTTLYRVNDTSPGEQRAGLRSISGPDDPGGVKWDRLTPIRHGQLAGLMRSAIRTAEIYATALSYAPAD